MKNGRHRKTNNGLEIVGKTYALKGIFLQTI
jgi:hypothetical protein